MPKKKDIRVTRLRNPEILSGTIFTRHYTSGEVYLIGFRRAGNALPSDGKFLQFFSGNIDSLLWKVRELKKKIVIIPIKVAEDGLFYQNLVELEPGLSIIVNAERKTIKFLLQSWKFDNFRIFKVGEHLEVFKINVYGEQTQTRFQY